MIVMIVASAFRGFNQYSKISGMLHQLMDPRVEYLENYKCIDGCQKLNTPTKAVYILQLSVQLSDALIIQLNIFKYIDGISKRFIPNLSIDEEISLWGKEQYFPVLFIIRENSLIADIIHQG